jgi:hypothetical protein
VVSKEQLAEQLYGWGEPGGLRSGHAPELVEH